MLLGVHLCQIHLHEVHPYQNIRRSKKIETDRYLTLSFLEVDAPLWRRERDGANDVIPMPIYWECSTLSSLFWKTS